jgi:predicted nucleic acid-binding protein
MAVLVDTGILYALADEDDAWHERARDWIDDVNELLIVPVTVLPEVAYLLHSRLDPPAELAFVQSAAAGELEIEPLRQQDLARTADVMRRYPVIGFVDATIVAMAERLKIETIATTDRRHLAMVKSKHTSGYQLLPYVD